MTMWDRLRCSGAFLAGTVFSVGLVLAFPAGAAAEAPVDLDGAYVLDTVGAIGGEEARVIDALDDLYA
ncbi:MAG: hypothetical protein LH471_01585, partial [Salinibacterium sp.]|nr:hypothetical protein [Salinibacterium sp.]